jgi:hypothetical protein
VTRPTPVGTASGALATGQQVGNALGGAVTGLVFLTGSTPGGHGVAHAFTAGPAARAVVVPAGPAGLPLLLPRRHREPLRRR